MTGTYYDKRDVERPGLPPEQSAPEALRDADGQWQWLDIWEDERHGLRFAYDEGDRFRTEDPLAIEIGERATEDLVLENGATDLERNEAQLHIRTSARVAHVEAINREGIRAQAEFQEQLARLDAELERGRRLLDSKEIGE